jgi:Tfp pilus assembly PilM family ATPase
MFFKKPLLGLDLGSSSVKIADLKVSGKKAVLNDLSMVPVAKGAISKRLPIASLIKIILWL